MEKMEKKQSQSNTYSIMVSCSNCGYNGTVQIPMGTTVASSTCPHCGCRTISNYSFTKERPRMRYIDNYSDLVDRGLRPNKFPWLNTLYSSADRDDHLVLTYTNDNGKEDFSVKLNGKELDPDDDKSFDIVKEMLGENK